MLFKFPSSEWLSTSIYPKANRRRYGALVALSLSAYQTSAILNGRSIEEHCIDQRQPERLVPGTQITP